jgi:hypothetical protein
MNFSWAMDLDPKGANNQIKEVIDKHYSKEDDDDVRLEDSEESSSRLTPMLEPMDAEDEQIVANDVSFDVSV